MHTTYAMNERTDLRLLLVVLLRSVRHLHLLTYYCDCRVDELKLAITTIILMQQMKRGPVRRKIAWHFDWNPPEHARTYVRTYVCVHLLHTLAVSRAQSGWMGHNIFFLHLLQEKTKSHHGTFSHAIKLQPTRSYYYMLCYYYFFCHATINSVLGLCTHHTT